MYIDFLFDVFNEFSDCDSIIWKGTKKSYRSLTRNIYKAQLLIDSNQIRAGAVVAVVGDFSPNSISLLLALIERACIIVPLTNTSNKNEDRLFEIAQVEYVFRINRDDITASESVSRKSDNDYYEKIRKRGHPGLILFTSGTTGEPKAAVHDFLPLLEKFKTRRKALRTLNFLLFDHWGGLNTMFHILSNGGVVVAATKRNPENVCKLIDRHKIELLPASPTFLNLMLLSGTHKNYDMTSLEIISYGTEPMSEGTLKRLRINFPNVKLLQTYGLIELGVMQSKSERDDSLWVKVGGDGYDTRVVEGMLEIKAKSAMLGYLNATSPFTEDGWFRTGDAVEVNGEYIKILGRDSEIINVGGEKVYPQEVESAIQEMDNVSEVTVYGEKNLIMGNIVCAKVRLRDNDDSEAFKFSLKKYCRGRLQSFKVPIKVQIVEEQLYSDRFKKMRDIQGN
jgi:acyl-coenzyme A synthetase/AMP-(fatty) acid ligase